MTTAEHIRSIASPKSAVTIAGVPWPRYKLLALLAGFLVALVVGVVTMHAAPAVVGGAAAGALVWLAAGAVRLARG